MRNFMLVSRRAKDKRGFDLDRCGVSIFHAIYAFMFIIKRLRRP